MKKESLHVHILAVFCVLCIACSLAGCSAKDAAQTDEERIRAALKRAGLGGAILESESYPQDGEPKHYVIRSETETCEGTDNPQLVGDVSFAADADGQMLLTVFHQSGIWEDSSRRINWKDWQKQFVFTALLYGGIEPEDEIYRAFCNTEMPNGMDPVSLDAELSTGRYCRLTLSCMSQKAYDDRGFEVRRYSATMRINVYGSREQYVRQRASQGTP